MTGAFPEAHGITNNMFHDVHDAIMVPSFAEPSRLQSETLAHVAESQGLITATLGGVWLSWPQAESGLEGPVMGWGNWYSMPKVVSNYDIEGAAMEPYLFLEYERIAIDDVDLPRLPLTSFAPLRSFTLEIPTYSSETFTWELIAFDDLDDDVTNYNHIAVVSRSTDGAPGELVATLSEGDWATLAVRVDGKRVGLHVKLLDLSGDLDRVRVYATAMRGPQIEPAWLEDEVSEFVSIPIGPARDAIIGGFVDEQTFAEEVIRGINWTAEAYSYVIARTEPDVVFAYFTETDEWLHRMMGYLDSGTPWYDGDLIEARRALTAEVFKAVDSATWRIWQAMGGPNLTTGVVVADHGFASTWRIANVNARLAEFGLYDAANPGESQAVAYSAGATTQVYVNLEGRESEGVVEPQEFDSVRDAIVTALETWRDDEGQRVLERVLTKEQAGSIMVAQREFRFANPSTTGDVVAFSNLPFQFDAATPGVLISDGIPYFSGQHGYIADTVPAGRGSMRPIFAAGGRGIAAQALIPETASLVDIAPTLAKLLQIPAPMNSEGSVLEIFTPPVD